MAEIIGRRYKRAQAKRTFRSLLVVSVTIGIDEAHLQLILDKRAQNPYLVASRLADTSTPMP
jgi:hypothetical protein